MKKTIAAGVALATVLASLASPAFAAPPRHRAPVTNDTLVHQYGTHATEVVTGGGSRVIADPDPNIVTQLLRDPDPSGF